MMIYYYASNETMGDNSNEACDFFRSWAAKTIQEEFPEFEVNVENEQSHEQTIVHDVDHLDNGDTIRSDVIDFCSCLWDSCPWHGFVQYTDGLDDVDALLAMRAG